jgi:phosphohistidine phosphatase
MDLLIVRHAIAENRDSVLWPEDSARPLTPAGEARFRRAARGLRELVSPVEVVLSSPYARAWRTAEILQEEAGWAAPERCRALEPPRDPRDLVSVIQERRGRSSVAVVGHEPGLSELASLLLSGDPSGWRIELKKGAVVVLSFPASPAPGAGLLRFAVTPKILRLLASGR